MTKAALLALLLAPAPAFPQTSVHIKVGGTSGESRLSLGLAPFVARDAARAADAEAAKQLQEVVRADLLFSRYFALLEDGPASGAKDPGAWAKDWRTRGAGWVLGASAAAEGPTLRLGVQLYDANSQEAVFEREYRQDSRFPRSLAHRVADDVVKALTGKNGIAHSRVAFSNDQSGHKEIYVMDYDGSGLRQVTRDRSIAILPRFSPGGKRVAYTSYRDGNPDLFLLELGSSLPRVVSAEQGLNVAGGFSSDEVDLLMTLSRQKYPNIYVKNLSDGSVTALTQRSGADSSPTFSPDASQVAFVSDRAGNPQIYLLDVTTRKPKRLTSLNWCDSPSWSPTGEWIAFAGRANPKDPIDIFLVDVTGTLIRQLTHGEGANENPAWSPDGRFLVFSSSRGKRHELYVMDADGSAPRRMADVPGDSATPTWSN